MAKTDPYFEAVEEHRRRLHRTMEKGGVARLKKIYDQAGHELAAKLRGHGKHDEDFTVHQHRIFLAQIKEGQTLLDRKLGVELSKSSLEARTDAVRGMTDSIKKLERHFSGASVSLPIEEASVFAGVIRKRSTSLLRLHDESMAAYGKTMVRKMEDGLAQSLIQGESIGGAIDRIVDITKDEWWRAERIARTELSYAASVAHNDALIEVQQELPDIMSQWIEYVSPDGEPLDDRVGVDSIAMAFQIAAPGEPFTMPATAPFPDVHGQTNVPVSLVGGQWTECPARPNGREFCVSWREAWGVPGWRYVAGERDWVNK